MMRVVLVIFYLLFPIIIIYLCNRFKFFNKVGAVVIAYIIGLIIGNLKILPEGSEKILEGMVTVTILLAIPLLLFSTNIRKWFRLAGKTTVSMFLSLFGLCFTVILGNVLFGNEESPDFWKISGMLAGVYSGGTPNMAALKIMLDVDADTYIITHTYDILISSVYLLFLMTIGQKVLLSVLLPFAKSENGLDNSSAAGMENYNGLLAKSNWMPLLKSFGLSVLVFTIGGGAGFLVNENAQLVMVILIITTLGIAFSFVPAINKIPKSFELGMYLIIVFCLVVASMADIKKFAVFEANIFYYIAMVVYGTLFIHVLLSRLFKVDTDTVMITSVALICSPPFVPMVAGAIKNREIIVSGLTVGIIGYVIGNYLGFFIAQMLKTF